MGGFTIIFLPLEKKKKEKSQTPPLKQRKKREKRKGPNNVEAPLIEPDGVLFVVRRGGGKSPRKEKAGKRFKYEMNHQREKERA